MTPLDPLQTVDSSAVARAVRGCVPCPLLSPGPGFARPSSLTSRAGNTAPHGRTHRWFSRENRCGIRPRVMPSLSREVKEEGRAQRGPGDMSGREGASPAARADIDTSNVRNGSIRDSFRPH
jgi:hypothetical protein